MCGDRDDANVVGPQLELFATVSGYIGGGIALLGIGLGCAARGWETDKRHHDIAYGALGVAVSSFYVVQDARTGLPYVGRSFNVALRLTQHIAAGKITPAAAANVRIFAGPTTLAGLRKAEQLMINRLGGTKSGAIANMRNEIAPRYWHGLGI